MSEPKKGLASLGLDEAVRLRWALRDIKGKRLKLSPIDLNDLRTMIDMGYVEIVDGNRYRGRIAGNGYRRLSARKVPRRVQMRANANRFVEWYTFMPRRFQSLFWRALDHVMPDGPSVFLTWVILILLIVSGIIAVSRW